MATFPSNSDPKRSGGALANEATHWARGGAPIDRMELCRKRTGGWAHPLGWIARKSSIALAAWNLTRVASAVAAERLRYADGMRTSTLTLAVLLGLAITGCSGGDSGGGGAGGEPLETPVSGKHGTEDVTLSYGFVRSLDGVTTFMEHDVSGAGGLAAVLSSAPVNCGTDMNTVYDSQHGLYLGLLFGQGAGTDYESYELFMKFRSSTRSRGLSTSGSLFGTLSPPMDGKYSGTIDIQYASGDLEDVVYFVGNVTLKDCDAK